MWIKTTSYVALIHSCICCRFLKICFYSCVLPSPAAFQKPIEEDTNGSRKCFCVGFKFSPSLKIENRLCRLGCELNERTWFSPLTQAALMWYLTSSWWCKAGKGRTEHREGQSILLLAALSHTSRRRNRSWCHCSVAYRWLMNTCQQGACLYVCQEHQWCLKWALRATWNFLFL